MQVQVLYFAGCPNHETTARRAREVAGELGLDVHLEEVEVVSADDAERRRFLGSPSVHVNGIDIEPSARSSNAYGLACRTYHGEGVPPRALLVAAFNEAGRSVGAQPRSVPAVASNTPPGDASARRPTLLMSAAGLFAVLASACCIGPLVLTLFGLSALGAWTAFASFRPLFLGTAAVTLGAAFYFAYFRAPECAPNATCAVVPARVTRLHRGFLWLVAVAVAGIALFPPLAGTFLGGGTLPVGTEQATTQEVSSVNPNIATVRLTIPGMDCPACVWGIERTLKHVPGVVSVSVNFKHKEAVVQTHSRQVPPQALADAVNVFDPAYKAAIHN